MDSGGNSRTLCATKFQHRLHILTKEGGLDSHLVGQVNIDDTSYALEDMTKFEIGIGKLAQIDNAHRHHLCLTVDNFQQAVAHEVGTRVDAQYDFLHIGHKGTKKKL